MDLGPVGVGGLGDVPDHQRIARLAGKGQLSGVVRQHLRKDVLRTERLTGRSQLRRGLVLQRACVRIGDPEQRALRRGLRQEVGHLLGEPVDRQVAVLGVVPLGREIEVVRLVGQQPGVAGGGGA